MALGYELTPDYHERTRIMAVQNFMGQFAWIVAPWFLWFMQSDLFFDNMIQGASWLAIIIGIFTVCVGILPAIFLKERSKQNPTAEQSPVVAVVNAAKQAAKTTEDTGSFKGFLKAF